MVGIVTASAGAWTLVLVWPGPAPFAVLVLLVLVLSTNGPGSVIGFDYARTSNPPERLGTASAIVNSGGFLATLTTVLAIGLVLQAVSSTGASPLSSYRWALAVQYLVWAVGLGCFLRHRRRAGDAVDAVATTTPLWATPPGTGGDRRPDT